MAWYCTLPWIVAQAAAAETPADNEPGMALKLLVAVAVVAGSFGGGYLLSRRLRMADYSFKIGLVLFTLIASLAVCIMGWPPKRGIDLLGGVVLIYEVERGAMQGDAMQTTVDKINEELNAQGGEKLEARPISSEQVEIAVPEGVDAARVEQAVSRLRDSGEVALRSAGTRKEQGKTVLTFSIDPRQQKAVDMNKLIAAVGKRINPSGVKELTIRQYGRDQIEVIVPEIEKREVDQIKKRISTSGMLEFRIVANELDDRELIRAALKNPDRDIYMNGQLKGRWVQAGPNLEVYSSTLRETKGRGREILVRIDPYDVTGKYLERASSGTSPEGGYAVDFSFDAVGSEKFGQLTSHNLPDASVTPPFSRRLGIVLDNIMLSAPNINSTIRSRGQITGHFTPEDVDFLVGVLNAGSLPATLRPEPNSEQRIGSQLGKDTIQKGTTSIMLSTAAILIFMAVYYRFCGLVADVAVVLNMIVTVALMILVKAAFTLPGLAGMVLTVGMAVDANVLIYERMREETERGASLRMAIRNGFGRAMATIIDSHVTTLVSAAVLYIVGTDQIKGFAVTLIIGLLMSLFTAVFVARVIFDIAEKQRWLTKLNLMHVIGHTNIDFIRWRGPAIAASVAITVIGFIATGMRGQEILDIDFTGGSSVQLLFAPDKPHDIAEVRRIVEEKQLPDVAVSSVGENNLEFKVDTSDRDISKVLATLQDAFAGSLQTYAMQYGDLSTIEAKTDESAKGPTLTGPSSVEAAGDAKPTVPATDEKKPSPPADAQPPAQEPPPQAEKPADSKPEEAKPDEPKPEESKTSHSRRGPRMLQFASAASQPAVLALVLNQAETDPVEKPAEPATEPPAAEKTPADEAPADAAAKPAETASPDSPAPAAGEPSTKPEKESSDAAAKTQTEVSEPPAGSMIGGTRVALTFPQEISYTPLREMVQKEVDALKFAGAAFELHNPEFQFGSDARYHEWTLETTLDHDQTTQLVQKIQGELAATPVFPSSNQIGGKVAGDTQLMALYAMLASMAIIVIYIWIRFQNVIFGLAAVLALVHDVFITVAFLALSSYLSPYLGFMLVDPFKISLAVLAALLTIVGFSINDTIVVFDRIREVRGKSPDLTEGMINLSVNATLSRTLLTSGTVFIASVILYFVGGPGIHAFAYSMVIGVIAGTYSSVYIAAPVLLWMKKPSGGAGRPANTLPAAAAGKK